MGWDHLDQPAASPPDKADKVSRRRYEREKSARIEAEQLLEAKSRELFGANEALKKQASGLEAAVRARTAELEGARQEAEQANEAKSAFLAAMSHEIRTPLNGVLGMAAALAESPLDEEQQQILQLISDSGNLLLSLVNDILDLSKVEAGKLELEQLDCSVNGVLDSVCQQFAPKMREKGLAFTTLYGGLLSQGEVWAKFDPTRFAQVLGNLLSNAVKFTNSGAVAFSASAASREDGNLLLRFSVRDTGCGISGPQQARLFQPFVQADASIARSHGGTGLGLAIARQICEKMGGGLTLTSAPDDGSEFSGRIVIEPAAPAAGTGTELASRYEDLLHSRRWRILVAEDNRTNQLVLKHMLKRFDLAVTMVGDGAQAVERWRAGGADLILMDVNMPVIDGVTATGVIRAAEAASGQPPLPVIAISANAMLHQIKGYLAAGMTGHVAKPIRAPELYKAMALALDPLAAESDAAARQRAAQRRHSVY